MGFEIVIFRVKPKQLKEQRTYLIRQSACLRMTYTSCLIFVTLSLVEDDATMSSRTQFENRES